MFICVDCCSTVDTEALKTELTARIRFDIVIDSAQMFLNAAEIQRMLKRHVTEDRVYGIYYHGTWMDFVDEYKLEELKRVVRDAVGSVLVIGIAAMYVTKGDKLIFADMTIWESQGRYRKGLCNFAANNKEEDFIRKFKRGYFIDWRVDNRHKEELFECFDYYLDTVNKDKPAMITRKAFDGGLLQMMNQPFRCVPFFDDGLWGGNWLEEVCDVELGERVNIAWGYNLLLQENEVNLTFGSKRINISGYTVSLKYPRELIGQRGYALFGAEYPIRYDFLDTMGGGNLSLQVHPTTQYIREHFGMPFTQDESYYYLDCAEKGCYIYLGLKKDVSRAEFAQALWAAQRGERFDDEKYINKIEVKKHEHYHIPAGTVHASGRNGMVLEISSSPAIFTFKLWDWGRVGLDGIPRPIHIEQGLKNVQFDRQTDWIMRECAYQPIPVREGDGFREEKTGLQEYEFITTHRTWATKKYHEITYNETQAINLVQGEEALIESPTGQFEPYVVHFAESVVIPALVGEYTIRPYGATEGNEIGVVKTFVKYWEKGNV